MNKKIAAYPYAIWAAIFIIVPLVLIVYFSLISSEDAQTTLTLRHFARAFEPVYLKVIARSIQLAAVSTIVCFCLGYPVAYIMSSKEYSKNTTLLFLFLVPMWMNFLLRTYAWLSILEHNGLINSLLSFIGLPKLNLIYNDFAVLLGMTYNFIPFMILPIYTVLKKIDHNIIEAAQDLGANGFNVFLRVVFPMSLPGVISGITMVFMPAVTTFVISNLLGGGQYILVGNLIEQQFLKVYDWSFGSAISVLLLIIIFVTIVIFSFTETDEGEGTLF